jgi:hypothetical protein
VGGEERGFDGGKKVKGRKRHLLVDTEGFVLEAKVHSAKVMDYEGIKRLLHRAKERFPRLRHLWLDAGYRGEDKGGGLGTQGPGLERGCGGASQEARPRSGAYGMGCGMGQRGRGGGLAEAYAPRRLRGTPEEVGGRANAVMDRSEQEDEQRLREAVCERGSVGVRLHDPPHGEAARSCLRTFHTVSEGLFSEVRLQDRT